MKKSLFTAVAAAVLAVATSGIATASITVANPTVVGTTWTYGISVDSLESINNTSYFTIYDFGNYQAGSIFAPAGWTAVAQLTGTTPGTVVVPDSGSIFNLVFTYTGATTTGPFTATGFGASTTIATPESLNGWFSYQAIKTSTSSIDQGDGNLGIPVATPEPMTLSLLGGGLALAGLVRLRRKA